MVTSPPQILWCSWDNILSGNYKRSLPPPQILWCSWDNILSGNYKWSFPPPQILWCSWDNILSGNYKWSLPPPQILWCSWDNILSGNYKWSLLLRSVMLYIFCHTGYNPHCLSQNMSHLPVAMHILYDMYAEYGYYSQCYVNSSTSLQTCETFSSTKFHSRW